MMIITELPAGTMAQLVPRRFIEPLVAVTEKGVGAGESGDDLADGAGQSGALAGGCSFTFACWLVIKWGRIFRAKAHEDERTEPVLVALGEIHDQLQEIKSRLAVVEQWLALEDAPASSR